MQKTPMYRSSRTAVALMAVASTMPVVITVANAGEGGYGYSSLAQREMIRRQNDVAEGDRLLAEGREAYAKGDYQQAVDKYTAGAPEGAGCTDVRRPPPELHRPLERCQRRPRHAAPQGRQIRRSPHPARKRPRRGSRTMPLPSANSAISMIRSAPTRR